MKTLIYKKLSKRLLGDWEKLWYKADYANYVNSPYWFLSVVKTFQPKDYAIVATYNKAKLVAIGALVKEKRYGVEVYATAPADFVCGTPFLVDLGNRKIFKYFADGIRKTGPIVLDNVPEQFVRVLKSNNFGFSTVLGSRNFYFNFNRDAKGDIVIRHKKRFVHRARDIEDKLDLKIFSGNNPMALKTVFDVDSVSTKALRGYEAFASDSTRRLYKSLAKNLKDNFLVGGLLYFGKKPIGYQIGFCVGKTYHCSQFAIARGYERYSLGRVLLIMLFDRLAAMGIEKIDFGSGDDHVKRSFTKESQTLYKVIIIDNAAHRLFLKMIYSLKLTLFQIVFKNGRLYSAYKLLSKRLRERAK